MQYNIIVGKIESLQERKSVIMLEKKIAALKNMSKEELVGEFEKIVLYNTQHLEACLGKSGQYEEAIKAEILSRMN
jgi:hypothetical protein|nr:MAG TPA: hypothetical protein [Caudoviricetes sp.]